jgi:hypothetical protein
MREVPDAFLLTVAEVSATLIGLFLVGAFYYAEIGLRRLGAARGSFEPYLSARKGASERRRPARNRASGKQERSLP